MPVRAPAPRRFSKSSGPNGNGQRWSGPKGEKKEPKILFQQFFKSVGPRTYAAQLKEAGNGNHFLVLTEGKRDEKTGEVRKSRLFVYSEDFIPFFKLLHETAQFVRANPVDAKVKAKRDKYWAEHPTDHSAPSNPETAVGHQSA